MVLIIATCCWRRSYCSHKADIREWVRVSAGQCSSLQPTSDIELLHRETRRTLFHQNSGHRTVQILTWWTTKSGLQCSSASTRQRFEMLTNCDSVCWTFGAALNKTSSTHPLTSSWRVRIKSQNMRAFWGRTFWTHAVNLSAKTYEQAHNIPGRHFIEIKRYCTILSLITFL